MNTITALQRFKIKRFSILKTILLCAFIGGVFSCNSLKGIIKDIQETTAPPGLQWGSRRDLTSEQFSAYFQEYKDKGWIIKDVDAYTSGLETKYAMIWEENTDARGWAEWRDLTSEGYHEKWVEYKNMGWRPTDIECYQKGSNTEICWYLGRK
ncbi:hypothetical protein N7U66_06075 [Lacinutrix neustonica]|uniref:Uncharacterized protein n=1 Tax=Lacinutrix neustonica TaxID=2980107 RepID=A0A9E8SEV8_9FLAO|nr:hypothetical protein [Lacinutrix neustonica]WAC03167.1 hypothetical protein N7U66_06075 [Lacinutrix neustonica]